MHHTHCSIHVPMLPERMYATCRSFKNAYCSCDLLTGRSDCSRPTRLCASGRGAALFAQPPCNRRILKHKPTSVSRFAYPLNALHPTCETHSHTNLGPSFPEMNIRSEVLMDSPWIPYFCCVLKTCRHCWRLSVCLSKRYYRVTWAAFVFE